MTSMMAKSMNDVDLVWVIPKVTGPVFSTGTVRTPITVTVFNHTYEVNVEEYVFANITYILLDSPVFQVQTAAEPYPKRMDELTSAIYCKEYRKHEELVSC